MMRLFVAIAALLLANLFPDFTLKDMKGRDVSWRDFQGKVVIVNLWMTTCPPCKKEMPMLQQLQNKYANRGVVVIGISADDNARTAASFARKLKVTYPILLDPLLMTDEAEQKKFGFLGLPTTFVIDAKGVIQKTIVGFADRQELENILAGVVPKL